MPDSIMKSFLSSASIWPKEKTSLWMGLFVASFETSGNETKKIIISSYGGFIFDPAEKRYYELPKEVRDDWYHFINDNAAMINF